MQAGGKPARTAEDDLVLARRRLVRIRFIGVFDTVGSLGIPGGLGRVVNRHRYQFHDTRLSGLVDLRPKGSPPQPTVRRFRPAGVTRRPGDGAPRTGSGAVWVC